jgi:hypothetical protein
VAHGVRLYSIASSRYGDGFDGQTTTLCVRRATYWDPEMKADDPAKKGLASNFLCDATPGTEIMMTGEPPLAGAAPVRGVRGMQPEIRAGNPKSADQSSRRRRRPCWKLM